MDTQGDAFFIAFPTAPGALAAASAFTEALASGPILTTITDMSGFLLVLTLAGAVLPWLTG